MQQKIDNRILFLLVLTQTAYRKVTLPSPHFLASMYIIQTRCVFNTNFCGLHVKYFYWFPKHTFQRIAITSMRHCVMLIFKFCANAVDELLNSPPKHVGNGNTMNSKCTTSLNEVCKIVIDNYNWLHSPLSGSNKMIRFQSMVNQLQSVLVIYDKTQWMFSGRGEKNG